MTIVRNLLLIAAATTSAFAQGDKLGTFTNSGDVGEPAIKGSTEFNASAGQYKITGSGANIWAKQDQFQYVWKEITGNFAVSATIEFVGKGAEHRKAGIMLRQSLDTDAAYADIMIHGNGEPAIQWRPRKGEDTNTFDFPLVGSGPYKVKFVRNGVKMYLYLAKDGGEPKEVAHTEVSLQGPVLLGLAICAHDPKVSETALFSNVSIEATPPAAAKAP